MIPDQQEIARSLRAAWRLAHLDGSGLGLFNLTVEGFWRSFFAAVLIAPGYALLVAEKLATWPAAVDKGLAVLIEVGAYGLSWVAFPVVAAALASLLGLSRRYVALIVAANWAEVLQFALFFTAMVVSLALPAALRGPVVFLTIGAVLFYEWFVARTALQTTAGVAAGFVIIDLLLGIGINLIADRLIWAISTPLG